MNDHRSLFHHGDPLDAAEAFVRHALDGDGWEGRDNYPDEDRKTWIERGTGENCERFIEQPLDDYESARVETLLAVARDAHLALREIADKAVCPIAGTALSTHRDHGFCAKHKAMNALAGGSSDA